MAPRGLQAGCPGSQLAQLLRAGPGSSVLQSTSSQSHVVMQDLPSPFYVWKSGLRETTVFEAT